MLVLFNNINYILRIEDFLLSGTTLQMKIKLPKIAAFSFSFSLIFFLLSCESHRRESRIPAQDGNDSLSAESQPIHIKSTKFFFENSGSMIGYINGPYDIKLLVSRILNGVNSDTIETYFINNKLYEVKGGVDNFIKNLTPAGIKIGNTNNSDLNNILQLVLDNTNEDEVSMLVTDGIYSVQGNVNDILGQLKIASESTYKKFRNRLSEADFETILIKLNSDFQGFYYPAGGGSLKINQKRPYYLWLFGTAEMLSKAQQDINFTELPGYKNQVVFQINDREEPFYTILNFYNRIGSFRPDRSQRSNDQITSIENVDRDRKSGEFQISIGVDFSNIAADNSYLLNVDNYHVDNDKFKIIEIVSADQLNGKDASEVKDKKISHVITIRSEINPVGEIEIMLLNKLPQWIAESNAVDDANILNDSQSTFGLQYLIDGIARAYYNSTDSHNYCKLKIKINE